MQFKIGRIMDGLKKINKTPRAKNAREMLVTEEQPPINIDRN